MMRPRMRFTIPAADVWRGFPLPVPVYLGNRQQNRPALVLFDLQQDAVVCRVTSVSHTGTLDVTLNDWQAAGLLKASVARLDRLVTAEKSIFLRRLGVLSHADLTAVRNTCNQHMRL
jgi:mRNA-degrading endonuclease toxin of MazEF toxin-antitoxin module